MFFPALDELKRRAVIRDDDRARAESELIYSQRVPI